MYGSRNLSVVMISGFCVALVAAPLAAAELTLNADKSCYPSIGDTVTVTVDMTNAGVIVVGGQFFLQFDPSALAFVDMSPGDAPFVNEIVEAVPGDDGPGTIDYSVGVANGDVGTMADSTMAVITFTTLLATCDTSSLVTFRTHSPPNRISDEFGGDVGAAFVDLGSISVDVTPPTVTCPPDMTVTLGDSTDPSDTGLASAVDNCDPAPGVSFADLTGPGASCPVLSVITRTWTATDACDNTDTCDQAINVNDHDSDGDGVVNCADGCPSDGNKTEPGQCGCGTPDQDTDGDTVLDCDDRCPGEDDLLDENGNGVPDCLDGPPIPAASTWGLALMVLVLCVCGKIYFRRYRRTA